MRCAACDAPLPTAFPGAQVRCPCGATAGTASAASKHHADSGPYRSSPRLDAPGAPSPCPFCGGSCPPLARTCPRCDVRLDAARCDACFALRAPGSLACARCGQPARWEPHHDATDAPCPRCRAPLANAMPPHEGDVPADPRVHGCDACGGFFVAPSALAEMFVRAETRRVSLPPDATSLGDVAYLPCPVCSGPMSRVNFGRGSGVVIDVCKVHGIWFDRGKLVRVLAYAAGLGPHGVQPWRDFLSAMFRP